MNKYSYKIINIINNVNYELKNNSIDLYKNPFIINLLNIINNSIQTVSLYFPNIIINKQIIPALHKINQYNLIYLLFSKLHTNNLIDTLFKYLPDITDYWIFIDWYNQHYHLINYDIIKNIIYKYNNDELISLFNIIFCISGNRHNLHKLLYDNSFISLDIQQEAETSNLFYYHLSNDEFNLFIYIPDNELTNSLHLSYIKHILIIINIIFNIVKFYNIDVSQLSKPTVILFLSNQKKYKPDKKLMLFTSNNVNSGMSIKQEIIYIWRFEEYQKVLIHELIHFYGIDLNLNYKHNSHIINTFIDIDGIDYCNEAFTETLATIIYMSYCSINMTKDLNIIYYNEIKFEMFQIAKIIHHFNGSSFSDLFKHSLSHIIIKQNTSVVSYYIIKMFFIYNINQFINIIEQIGLIYSRDNNSNDSLVNIYINFILKILNDKFNDSELIDKYIDLIIKSPPIFSINTMRMTCT